MMGARRFWLIPDLCACPIFFSRPRCRLSRPSQTDAQEGPAHDCGPDEPPCGRTFTRWEA